MRSRAGRGGVVTASCSAATPAGAGGAAQATTVSGASTTAVIPRSLMLILSAPGRRVLRCGVAVSADREPRPQHGARRAARHRERAGVADRDVTGDGEPQPGSARVARPRLVEAGEAVENRRLLVGRDARPV